MFALNSTGSCLIADPGIPMLAKGSDPVVLGECLTGVLPSAWGVIRDIRLQLLKHHPSHRCTFEIILGTTTGRYSLIGKVYAKDRADVYEAMERIRRAGFGQDQEFSIPRPQGYVPELHLLLQEKVEGSRAKDVFHAGSDRDHAVTAERCARWLASFHAQGPKAGPVLELDDHLATMGEWSSYIAGVAGALPLAEKAGRLLARLQVAASGLTRSELRAAHGSYSPAQVFLTGVRTITFDWDSYRVADPCRDVARFIVALQRRAFKYLGPFRALDMAVRVFLESYFSNCGLAAPANLPFYRAAMCLQLAKKDIHRQNASWFERAEVTLDEGLRVLEQGV
jgi:aminoglycoside phosphotransferase (APT) family kinase protein